MTLTRRQYIDKVTPLAIEACKNTGLFPSLMVAQGIIESGNGNSSLAALYNNHFGIKADKGWKGKSVRLKTREVFAVEIFIKDAFRVYETIKQGFFDRNEFLKKNPRYTKAGVFTAKDANQQADAFQKAGYATDPNYAKILKQVNKTLVIPVPEPTFLNVAIRLINEDYVLASLDEKFRDDIMLA